MGIFGGGPSRISTASRAIDTGPGLAKVSVSLQKREKKILLILISLPCVSFFFLLLSASF